MARYKVPQDVEADDKLIGPFSFRQFVYLLIVAGLLGLAVGLFQLFPLLAIIPVPFILFFAVLALPIKKDQPMETYLAAIVSYYLKPHKRIWTPGQRDSIINITAPKIVEEDKKRDITSEEATHRLSFLADIVDTQGYAIKGGDNPMRDDLIAEANATTDMFETIHFDDLEKAVTRDKEERHDEVVREMREAIEKNENMNIGSDTRPEVLKKEEEFFQVPEVSEPPKAAEIQGNIAESKVEEVPTEVKPVENTQEDEPVTLNHSIIELANNTDFTVATIAKEANRIKERDGGEVFISLH